MHPTKRLFPLGLIALAAVASGCVQRADVATEERVIRDLDKKWVQAVAAKDTAAIANVYAVDAEFLAPGAPRAGGRAAVRQATAAADIEDVTQKHPVTPGAVLPARELLGDLLLELNRPADAARAYEASLRQAPGRARSLFGLARAAERAGDNATARERYQEFLTLMHAADGDRPEILVDRRPRRA